MTASQPVTDPPTGNDDGVLLRLIADLQAIRADLVFVRDAVVVAEQLTGVTR